MIHSFGLFGLYLLSGVAMLATFTYLYMKITPYDERTLISDGKIAPAIALVGAMIGFTLPIVAMSYHGTQFWEYMLWSVVAGLVQLGCFGVIYKIMPKQIETDNIAAAVFYAGASVCVGLINAFSLIP